MVKSRDPAGHNGNLGIPSLGTSPSSRSAPFDEPRSRELRNPRQVPPGANQQAPIWVDESDDGMESDAAIYGERQELVRVKTGEDASLGSADVVEKYRVKHAKSLDDISLGSADVLVIDSPPKVKPSKQVKKTTRPAVDLTTVEEAPPEEEEGKFVYYSPKAEFQTVPLTSSDALSKKSSKSKKEDLGGVEDKPKRRWGSRIKDATKPKESAKGEESKTRSKSKDKKKESKSKKSKKSSRSSKSIKQLKNEEDPNLEKELEEIALTGRGAMIGGSGVKHIDIEKGSTSTRGSSSRWEDEADRSWHGELPSAKPSKDKRKTLVRIVLGVLGVAVIAIASYLTVAHAVRNKGPSKTPNPNNGKLTARQEAIHNILLGITDESTLMDPSTPQNHARDWLLFRDSDLGPLTKNQVIQRYALITFYFSTGGEEVWRQNNWLKGHECAEGSVWQGLNCNPEGEVRTLFFDNERLLGTMPDELGQLSKLENLILKNNKGLGGEIPSALGHCSSLIQLALYNNNLKGKIPWRLAHAQGLHYINLEQNRLDGPIPEELGTLSKLHTLVLANNELGGLIPMKALSKAPLRFLMLSNNKFSSVLQKEVGDISTLNYLYLDNNELRGTLPGEIGRLEMLKSLNLGQNFFSGTIPGHFSHLAHLDYLSLNDNQLDGTLTPDIGLLSNLKTLNLGSNKLSGPLPDMSKMRKLVNLHLYQNKFTGTIPDEFQQLQHLEVLFLSSNMFTGSIPDSILSLDRTMRGVYLSDNQLTGTIPQELCAFGALEALFMDTNKFSGPIPTCFGVLSELRQLYLFNNLLTGSVPSQLKELQKLSGIGLEKNNIDGAVPDGVCELATVKQVDFWADCAGSSPVDCPCCTVCCPGDDCV